jgi:hypothetical protein
MRRSSCRPVLGAELATRLHGQDWREHQSRSVSDTLAAPSNRGWVAEADGEITGFASPRPRTADRRIGEIAVDPQTSAKRASADRPRHRLAA